MTARVVCRNTLENSQRVKNTYVHLVGIALALQTN